MKHNNIFYYPFILLVIFTICSIAGCGGGGSSSSGGGGIPYVPVPIYTPTTIPPTFTPTPLTNRLTGSVLDITTNNLITGSTLAINSTSFVSTTGTFDFSYNNSGNNVLTISGPNNVTRETPIDPNMINQNFNLLPSGFNTTFLRAMFTWKDIADPNIVYNKDTTRWVTPQKYVLYSKMPDGTDATTHLTEIIKQINLLKGLNYNIIKDISYEIFNGRPADDPRWIPTGDSTPTNYMGCINQNNSVGICVASLTGAAGSTTAIFTDSQGKILGGGITIAPVPNPATNTFLLSTILHELLHSCGFFHPFENILSTDWPTLLEQSIMNYNITGKRTNEMSNYDKYCLSFLYNRAPNNIAPDKNTTLLVSSGVPDDIKIKTTIDPVDF